ncbi:MAG: 4-alpha-glucanotransferase [Acidimicrobiales bacterium]
MTTDGWGVDDGWAGNDGAWHQAPDATLAAIRAALNTEGNLAPPGRPARILRPGVAEQIGERSSLVLEDGTDLGEVHVLGADLPLGLHDLTSMEDGAHTTVIVSPGQCYLPDDYRTWGVAMQIPTACSRRGWGIGDLADVRSVAAWLAGLGAGALALSPVHAPTPVSPIQPSPYYPSSRRWRSPLLLRVDEVPGAADLPEVAVLASEARSAAQVRAPIVDRDVAWDRQRRALELIWEHQSMRGGDAFERWRRAQGQRLEGWARFCALAEGHGPLWSAWPRALRHPDDPAVASAVERRADRVAFHTWLQFLVDQQLHDAKVGEVRLIHDLAIGVDPNGGDAWLDQDLLALDISVGAPPDDFAPAGQTWGLPPFVPWRLRDAGYRPWAELLRAAMAQGGLRVDHVMGLSRLFWIPTGASPAEGTYVRFPPRDLLEVLALESARAQAVVIGEDLGTVEGGFRHDLMQAAVLSTRLVWFEDPTPEHYPPASLAMVTTHDLPTITGAWTGTDEAELAALDRGTPTAERGTLRRRLDTVAGLPASAPAGTVIDAVHRRLGRSPAALTLATLEDLCEVAERPNVPGTIDERANWSRALPVDSEDLSSEPSVAQHLAALADGRRD